MQKSGNRSIIITFYKIQLHMDQGIQHKASYQDSDKSESGEESWNNWHRKSLSEKNTDSTGTKENSK